MFVRQMTNAVGRSYSSFSNPMEMGLSSQHAAFQSMVREFAQEELRPIADELDAEKKFPKQQVKKMGELGLMGVEISKDYGGAGLDGLSYAIAMEEISRACAGTGTVMTAHNSIFMGPINKFGSHEQKLKILPNFVTGDSVGCFMLSEPGNGSDAGAASTLAVFKDDHYNISGTKAWITNSWESSGGSLFATTDRKAKHKGISCFYIPFPSDGLSLGAKESKMGIRCTSTANVIFDDCQIPQENLIGESGQGFKIAMQILDAGRIPIGAQGVGIAADALQRALDYVMKKDVVTQMEEEMLADMEVMVTSARLLTLRAAKMKDEGKPIGKIAAMAKLYGSEVATKVSHKAIQIMGADGLKKGGGVERNYRDARITEIYEGTSEIQKVVIAGHMKKEYKNAIKN
eukprot:TRINITY_DN5779_c0_g1_i1.p1 TRINITY_DN5779_c0_g1~~TRINITY_DN5779_c0_g1_i1.p1  ORF type:complete len:415 (-),score=73.81 TRINITY_DN5779_c0_g1_i1:95-1300(-)